jgi:hypothetical protein
LRRPVETTGATPGPPPMGQPQVQPPAAPAPAPQGQKKKSHAALIVIIVFLVLLSGMGAGGYFLYSRVKSYIGLESMKILNLPWMKKAEEKPPEDTAKTEQPPAKAAEEKAAQAVLKIASQPLGADVLVDGEAKGKTPLTLGVDLGNHSIRFSTQGYEEREEEIHATESREYPVEVKLVAIPVKPAAERKTGDTSSKTATKRGLARPEAKTHGGTSTPERPRVEQPRVVTPPPVVSQPPQQREPKREKPSDGWVIKDLQDR